MMAMLMIISIGLVAFPSSVLVSADQDAASSPTGNLERFCQPVGLYHFVCETTDVLYFLSAWPCRTPEAITVVAYSYSDDSTTSAIISTSFVVPKKLGTSQLGFLVEMQPFISLQSNLLNVKVRQVNLNNTNSGPVLLIDHNFYTRSTSCISYRGGNDSDTHYHEPECISDITTGDFSSYCLKKMSDGSNTSVVYISAFDPCSYPVSFTVLVFVPSQSTRAIRQVTRAMSGSAPIGNLGANFSVVMHSHEIENGNQGQPNIHVQVYEHLPNLTAPVLDDYYYIALRQFCPTDRFEYTDEHAFETKVPFITGNNRITETLIKLTYFPCTWVTHALLQVKQPTLPGMDYSLDLTEKGEFFLQNDTNATPKDGSDLDDGILPLTKGSFLLHIWLGTEDSHLVSVIQTSSYNKQSLRVPFITGIFTKSRCTETTPSPRKKVLVIVMVTIMLVLLVMGLAATLWCLMRRRISERGQGLPYEMDTPEDMDETY